MTDESGTIGAMKAVKEAPLVYPVDRSWRDVRTISGSDGEPYPSARTLLHRSHPEDSDLYGVAFCTGGKGGRITALILEDAMPADSPHRTRLCRRCFPLRLQ